MNGYLAAFEGLLVLNETYQRKVGGGIVEGKGVKYMVTEDLTLGGEHTIRSIYR